MNTVLKAGLAGAILTLATAAGATAQTDEILLGEMRIFPIGYCPRGWVEANGQMLSISSNTALYSLYGTQFGGDGRTTFALPDMRGRLAVGIGRSAGGSDYIQGEHFGLEAVTLTVAQLPQHNHQIHGTSLAPDVGDLGGHGWGEFAPAAPSDTYNTGGALTETARAGTIAPAGGGQAHNNIAPSLVLRHCVAEYGLYPSRN